MRFNRYYRLLSKFKDRWAFQPSLRSLKNNLTMADLDFKLDRFELEQLQLDPPTPLNRELKAIAIYVQYVLVPMEEKADYDLHPTDENLKRKLPLFTGYEFSAISAAPIAQ